MMYLCWLLYLYVMVSLLYIHLSLSKTVRSCRGPRLYTEQPRRIPVRVWARVLDQA